jgi:hypothetical protein
MIQKIYLIIREILAGGTVSLIVFIAVAASSFSISSFISVGRGVENSVIDKFESKIPPDIIKVTPHPPRKPGILDLVLRKSANQFVDEKSLRIISSLREVKAVYPLNASQIPIEAVISFFALNYKTDLICIGAPEEFVNSDIRDINMRREWKDWKPGREMPVLIPEILLEAYNNSLAEPNGLPRITPDMATGRVLRIIFGKSSIKELANASEESSKVTGFTDKIKSICLVIPIQAVSYYNGKFKDAGSESSYMCAYVRVDSHSSLLTAAKRIEKMGFIAETDKTLSEEMLSLRKNLRSAILLFTDIVLMLSLFSVIFSTMIAAMHRLEYYRMMRVLGASRIFISISLIIKYAVIGFAASLGGFFLMKETLSYYISSFKIQGFEINLKPEPGSLWIIVLAGTLLSILATLPALIFVQTARMNRD